MLTVAAIIAGMGIAAVTLAALVVWLADGARPLKRRQKLAADQHPDDLAKM